MCSQSEGHGHTRDLRFYTDLFISKNALCNTRDILKSEALWYWDSHAIRGNGFGVGLTMSNLKLFSSLPWAHAGTQNKSVRCPRMVSIIELGRSKSHGNAELPPWWSQHISASYKEWVHLQLSLQILAALAIIELAIQWASKQASFWQSNQKQHLEHRNMIIQRNSSNAWIMILMVSLILWAHHTEENFQQKLSQKTSVVFRIFSFHSDESELLAWEWYWASLEIFEDLRLGRESNIQTACG